jgi:hypothetical protein
MLQLRPTSRRPIVLVILALALASLTGCVPTVWLPDSSGFIYVKPIKVAGSPSGQLVQYDLQKKTSRVIVEDVGAGTSWPALSPDGKRIAVARVAGGPKDAKTVQIALYDMQGKQLHLSKIFAWAPAMEDAIPVPSAAFMLFWSPKNDMVVVTDASESGVYNVKTDTLKVIDKAAAVIHGGTPIRPDGKGFLVLLGEQDNARLVLMDWEGKDQKIDADAFAALIPKDKSPGSAIATTVLAALMLPSGWDGNTAWVGFKRDKATYAINTDKKKIEFTEAFAALMKSDKKDGTPPLHFDFAGDITVKTIQFKAPIPPQADPNVKITGEMSYNKVVIFNNKTKKEEMLLDKGPGMAIFLPSPDGNYLALCLTSIGPGQEDLILVINNKGELVSKLSF